MATKVLYSGGKQEVEDNPLFTEVRKLAYLHELKNILATWFIDIYMKLDLTLKMIRGLV